MNGILLVYKALGLTSHDVVNFIRKKFDLPKVGHAGTLDPAAEGLLVLLIGKATKLFSKFSNQDKQYLATIKLGQSTDTLDREGKVIEETENIFVTETDVKKVLDSFKGEILQIPPMFSAVKKNGKKLYDFARKGKVVERKPRKIVIYNIEMVDFKLPFVVVRIKCSKGTYTRKICDDLGKNLGIPAHQFGLIRERCGNFEVKDSIKVEKLNFISKPELEKLIIPIEKN